MPARHDHDAAGDPTVLAHKAALREEAWAAIANAGAGRFPGIENRIPNFIGAEAAAERLRATDAWRAARTIKANPDSPQLPVRQRALEDGKTVFMAVPRLARAEPFILLDPDRLEVTPRQAASIKGSAIHGQPVPVDELEPVDLVVTGCVAVDIAGARLGKGGGFSDLEHAIAHEAGLVGPATTIATTVHEAQVFDEGRIPLTAHDVHLDLIVTPDRVVVCRDDYLVPHRAGVHWDELSPDKIAAIPILAALAEQRRGDGEA